MLVTVKIWAQKTAYAAAVMAVKKFFFPAAITSAKSQVTQLFWVMHGFYTLTLQDSLVRFPGHIGSADKTDQIWVDLISGIL